MKLIIFIGRILFSSFFLLSSFSCIIYFNLIVIISFYYGTEESAIYVGVLQQKLIDINFGYNIIYYNMNKILIIIEIIKLFSSLFILIGYYKISFKILFIPYLLVLIIYNKIVNIITT